MRTAGQLLRYLFICMALLGIPLTSCARPSVSSPIPLPSQPNAGTPGALKPGDYDGATEVGGRKRTYLLHLPSNYDGRSRLPLVIVLHGGGGNARNAPIMTGMSAKADADGFIAVYPNGSGRLSDDRLLTWNSGNCCGYALDNNIDDVAFISALIDDLQGRLAIDPSRIYATGISNGGMMSYLLACQLGDKIAAIAPVAGAMGMDNCQPAQPVSVIIFHGTADEHVLYNGGKPVKQADRHPRIDKPVSYAVDFWVKANGCNPTPQKEARGNIIKETYSGGKNSTEVVLYTIVGGKHSWPGGSRGWLGGDESAKEISATDAMWDFFQQHPKARAAATTPTQPIRPMTGMSWHIIPPTAKNCLALSHWAEHPCWFH